MKKIMLVWAVAVLLGFAGYASAGDCCSASPKVKNVPCVCKNKCECNPCKCTKCECEFSPRCPEEKKPVQKRGKYCNCGKVCKCDPCECNHEPLTRRVWVEDVYTPGLWYHGYYVIVDEGYEFHYQKREVRAALSNFNTLVWVNYKHNLKLSNRPSVKVIYKP